MVADITVGYFEAWAMWARGEELRTATLWGLDVLWWARGSKVLGLIAALTIAVEIVGEDRLQRVAVSMRGSVVWRARLTTGKAMFKASIGLFGRFLSGFDPKADTVWNRIGFLVMCFAVVLSIATIAWFDLARFVKLPEHWWPLGRFVVDNIALVILFYLLYLGIFVLVCGLYFVFLGLVGTFAFAATSVVGVIASLLAVALRASFSHPSLAMYVRVASLLLVVIAFHFDFLAS